MFMPKKRILVAGGVFAVVVAAGGGTAVATAGDDETGSDQYTQQQADDATAAALAATGGGKANSVERDGENGAVWEVEVTKPDGATVDVRLDKSYQVVVIESDSEEPGESQDGED